MGAVLPIYMWMPRRITGKGFIHLKYILKECCPQLASTEAVEAREALLGQYEMYQYRTQTLPKLLMYDD